MNLKELQDKFCELKEAEKILKEKLANTQLAIYQEMQKLGTDRFGSKEDGLLALVYRTEYIIDPEARMELIPLESEIDKVATELDQLTHKKKEKEAEIIQQGRAKEDKQFSYVKLTPPKK